jgi:hypothetical protein
MALSQKEQDIAMLLVRSIAHTYQVSLVPLSGRVVFSAGVRPHTTATVLGAC